MNRRPVRPQCWPGRLDGDKTLLYLLGIADSYSVVGPLYFAENKCTLVYTEGNNVLSFISITEPVFSVTHFIFVMFSVQEIISV
jgi:hypothetical protein